MRVPRVFHSRAQVDRELELGREAFGHVVRVLRKSAGDALLVLDGVGGVYRAEILRIESSSESLWIKVLEPAEETGAPVTLPLGIAVGIPRGDGMELAIRLASETGLSALQPLMTERTVPRPRGTNKVERWRRIATESAEQCRRLRPLEIPDPLEWKDFRDVAAEGGRRVWVALPGAPSAAEAGLLELLRTPEGDDGLVLIGPEGGFSPVEIDESLERGFRPLGFPTPVMRTPTAVVYVAALASLAHQDSY